ncbi:hypothetical protein GDO78_012566 [Eleutherodactylus coqui]|uniref:Laminin subunit alpha 3 n=1 Tax=Eleutherodactylus coqui TaxID=57060 RepID=A0A8J6F250_ELECQ|nr:hypothetical protein GDO78_012566 [Eleutherodactylus coqui]
MVPTTRNPRCPWGYTWSCARLAGALMASALLLCLLPGGRGQEFSGAGTGFSLHPPAFNLAEGAKIRATATCGEEESGAGGAQPRVDLYCKLVGGPVASSTPGHTIQGQSCDFCSSSNPNKAHPASNAIDGTERWWQSPPLSLGLRYNEVNVTIDLGQIFHVAYVLIKFANSPRPDLWVLERSVDFGSSYMPWQYFANSKQDCLLQFGKDIKQPITRDDDVICTTEYSRIVPLENGEVVVRLVSGRPGAKHFMDSPVLRDFTKATNIRLRFLRTNTLLGHLISKAEKDPTVTRRYYYSIKDISIGGRCVCHGHANVCSVRSFGNQNLYQCNCQHNTCGEICDHCCPGYNQKPWRPASIDTANQCERCNCHGHASDCYYDSDVDNRQASLDIHGQYSGGGVCINCQHNTAGINCEKCAVGYFRPYGVPKEAPHGCIPCSCSPQHTDGCEEGSGRCYCKPNFSGYSCERCAEGYYGYPICLRIPIYPPPTTSSPVKPTAGNIKGCNCRGVGAISNNCDTLTGQCPCHVGYHGIACDTCAPGYFHYPFCQRCDCNAAGVLPKVCRPTGSCLCRLAVEGARCDQCRPGYHSFPSCKGECLCRPQYAGQTCNQCAPNFYNYPLCIACQCSPQGSYRSTCDPVTGQCECRRGISGQTCDRCSPGLDNYPFCEDDFEECDPVGTLTSQVGFCQCLPRVEGVICDRCKPLYWNLDEGCIDCDCDVEGTISGIGECHQNEGVCHCKPNARRPSCESCREGYFNLDGKNYFGCKGCQCDVGGSLSHVCDEATGRCNCRNNIEGQNCNQPKQNYYFPDLHQMKFEIEDGTSSSGRAVRFGYNSQEFPGFSWRGYAQMSSLQNEVRVPVTVGKSNLNLFRIILRYVNPDVNAISGQITAQRSRSSKGSFDVKDIVFPPSTEPAFLTVPGKSFAEPFSLVPGNWIITISVEGVLLDYLVLLPSDYYEASILQLSVTQPCDYSGPVGANCLVFQHLPLEKFTCLHGTEMEYFKQEGDYRPIIVRQPSYGHPLMAAISGRQVELHFSIKVPQPGVYALIFEYANEDDQQYFLNVMIRNDPSSSGRVNLYSCKYSFLCRSIAVDSMNRIAKFEMLSDSEIHVTASSHTVCIIPIEELSVEYAEPKVHCIAAYGRTPGQSPACIQSSVYENLPLSLLLDPVKDAKDSGGQKSKDQEPVHGAGFPKHQGNRVLLSPQQEIIVQHQWSIGLFQESILLVPAGSYKPDILQETPLDKSFDFINICGENSFYIDPISSPEFCKDSARTLVAYYNNGALPCRCHSEGSTSPVCHPFGGQCTCRPNVIGRTCSRCATGYYGFPYCRRKCKPRISGRQCDRCAPSYFRFPDCIPCDCNSYGTEPQICDSHTGVCLCKENTEGSRCDVCRSGSFYFDPSNAKGCIRCFCFGATNTCHSSKKQRKKFVDMRFWILEASDQTRVDVTFNPGSNSVVADVQELPPSVHSLYWIAPASYLGERISSYGGYLTYQLKSFGLPNEGMVLLDKRPDVLLTGRQMTVVYVDPTNPLPDRQYYGRVQLVESNFRHASSNSLVSREELMIILSRLESLHIRALYFTETQRLTLGEVGLEDVTISGSGRAALNVEICDCPPEYTGDSCQECAPGHYRENQGLYLGRCVPCRCNGHSTRCHDVSGICINCQHNTKGDHCELCKEGYSGDATQDACTLCSCPLTVASNNFATGCSGSGRNLKCFCKPGYTGSNCEGCAQGYYGNPLRLGGKCQPCNCGNNGQLISCDPLTGECLDDPKDRESDDLCDSCADILLMDLRTISNELNLIKAELQSINVNSQALEKIRALEARIREVKQECDNYNRKHASQQLKVDSMNTETNALKLQIAGLLKKAEMNSKKYESIMMNVDDTSRNVSHMLVTIDLLIKNINILIENAGKVQGGATGPGEVSKNMEEAQRMLNEMRKRNFNAQKKEAEFEKEEAKSLLNRVRNQFQKHGDQHRTLIREINKSLKDYEEKLHDLRDAMVEASGQTKQANDLNKQNAMTLEDIKKRLDDLKRQEKEATNHLKAAETKLEQAKSIVELLKKSKEEYTKLAAQLYGAEREVTEKVTNVSKAASKEPLVIMAEKHAQSLLDLANELQEIKKNTSNEELVRCAIDATNAYQDIINSIKAAEEAANKAKTAADSALTKVQSEDLPGKAKKSLTDSDALLQQAKKTQKSFSDANPKMEDIKDRLTAATDKKNRLLGDLTAVQGSIKDIKRDDIENMITNAKSVVANAAGIINNVQAELKPIREDVENLTGTIGTAQNTSFNEALTEARNSVMKLSGSLPDVFDAMNRINSLVPLGNISESVSRIRELIQQARDAANKVSSGMSMINKFDGNSGVEVRPPSNLEDLKAYTSLSFFLQRPQSRGDRRKRQLPANMFVMYLGSKDTSKDYIGVGVEDGKLMCVYNLGGSVSEINVREFVSSNKAEESVLDRVVLERLNFPKYQGCIELDDINQNAISLYNFRQTFNIDTRRVEPCKRYKEQSEGSFFEGFGYAKLLYSVQNINRLRFDQAIQTTSDVGLLFFAEKEESYISLEIENGSLVLKYKLNADQEPQKRDAELNRVNTGQLFSFALIVEPNARIIRIAQGQKHLSVSDVDAFLFSKYYFGGAPTASREKFNIKTPSFRGCIRNIRNPGGAGQFNETYGVSSRCYSEWSIIRSAEFSNGGRLGLKPDGFSFPGDFQASFGFQTPQVNAMLLNHRTQSDELHVSLEAGTVSVTTTNSNVNLRSRDKYSDGKLHYVSVIRNNNEYKLLVDDEEETENTDSSRRAGLSPSDIYIGGNGFKGCMTNVFISRDSPHPTVQNLFDNTEKDKVSLGMCIPDEAPTPLILSQLNPLNLRLNDFYLSSLDNMSNLPNAQTELKNIRGCTSPSNFTSHLKSYRFGDSPASHLVYDLSMQSFKDRSHFSLEVQTEQSSGLIFSMTNKQESSYLALHKSKGRFVFSVSTKGNKLKIKSQEKYSDGKWHTVAFSWDGTNGRLVIDGLNARKGSLQKHLSLENMSLLYLGGVPSLKVQGIPKKSFTGCLKNVNINEVTLDRPSRTVGVTPCYDGSYETGVYFAEGSGHVLVDKALNLGHEFEISFEIRPQSQESALLHIREGKENRLSLSIDNKKVTLSINNKEGNFQVSVTPVELLCDGKWHTITVRQKDNAVRLDVDKQSKGTAISALTSIKEATLYIGGLPDALGTQRPPPKSLFVGCMKNLKVNKKVINFSKITDVHGAISLSRCPAA